MNAAAYSPWINIVRPNPHALLRLFCFSYAGGAASLYRTWQDILPAEVEVCALQLPGRENRLMEPLFTNLTPLIDDLASEIRPYLHKPFVFFGHSMGALVSFELTRKLRSIQAELPLHLFVSAFRAPQLPDPDTPIHALPYAEFIDELHRLNGTPRSVLENSEIMQIMEPILRADFSICETYIYQPEPPLHCPISVFGGLQDADISQAQLADWQHQTRRTCKVAMFEGDHFYLTDQRASLLQNISQQLTLLLHHLRKMPYF